MGIGKRSADFCSEYCEGYTWHVIEVGTKMAEICEECEYRTCGKCTFNNKSNILYCCQINHIVYSKAERTDENECHRPTNNIICRSCKGKSVDRTVKSEEQKKKEARRVEVVTTIVIFILMIAVLVVALLYIIKFLVLDPYYHNNLDRSQNGIIIIGLAIVMSLWTFGG